MRSRFCVKRLSASFTCASANGCTVRPTVATRVSCAAPGVAAIASRCGSTSAPAAAAPAVFRKSRRSGCEGVSCSRDIARSPGIVRPGPVKLRSAHGGYLTVIEAPLHLGEEAEQDGGVVLLQGGRRGGREQ